MKTKKQVQAEINSALQQSPIPANTSRLTQSAGKDIGANLMQSATPTPPQAGHTPGPWHRYDNNIIGANNRAVAMTSVYSDSKKWQEARAENDANAAFIVTSCNSHEELVTALKGLLENYRHLKRMSLILARSDSPDWMTGMTEDDDIHIKKSEQAIARAEGGK